jgi:hypothetical protein
MITIKTYEYGKISCAKNLVVEIIELEEFLTKQVLDAQGVMAPKSS